MDKSWNLNHAKVLKLVIARRLSIVDSSCYRVVILFVLCLHHGSLRCTRVCFSGSFEFLSLVVFVFLLEYRMPDPGQQYHYV
ncbi:hypothetical protein C8R42DRAFT_672602 [Lentinula raphanica]|nr:hypothetical protein C8R42DRAFT_672602 [Lentinula raphanica]